MTWQREYELTSSMSPGAFVHAEWHAGKIIIIVTVHGLSAIKTFNLRTAFEFVAQKILIRYVLLSCMKSAHTTEDFGNICKITGEREVCLKYIEENGGMLYTQIDGDDYICGDGSTCNVWYVEGDVLVNRTGVYGVA